MFKIVFSVKGMNWKFTAASLALVVNAFIWYLLAFDTLKGLLDGFNTSDNTSLQLLFFGINAGAIAVSALLGSFVIDKFKKRVPFLYLWTFAGIIISIVPLGLNTQDLNQLMAISIIFGAYFGLGMPVIMGYYSSSISIEKRAKTSGIAFLLIGLIFSIIGMITIGNLVISCAILVAIRLSGLVLFHGTRNKEKEPLQEIQPEKYSRIIRNKNFLLYFIPWGIFSLVNYLVIPIISQNPNFNFSALSNIVEYVIVAVVAVICGFLADTIGRKRFAIIGFVMLGLGFAGLTLFPPSISGYVYIFADGVAWGIFYVVFLLTIWGDLAQSQNSDKFYVIGAMPFLFSNFMKLLFQPYLSTIPAAEVFSFASVFLFIAVLPLYYAPETLSDKIMKDHELKAYLDKAQKIASKESEKKPKQEKTKDQEKETEALEEKEENSKEQDEARKLAEKYY